MTARITFEELESFLRQRPPRTIPANLLAARIARTPWGVGLFVGGILLLVGSILMAVFFPWRILDELALKAPSVARATGEVTLSEPTNNRVNNQRVYRVGYTFQTPQWERHTGTSYYRGDAPGVGQPIEVRYLPSDPGVNRSESGSLNPFGLFGIFVSLLPGIGALLVIATIRGKRSQARLLRDGEFASGVVVQCVPLTPGSGNSVMHRVVIEFPDGRPQPSVEILVQAEEARLAQDCLASQDPIGVLYDPAQPTLMIFPESLVTD
jgi:hypothetical protein